MAARVVRLGGGSVDEAELGGKGASLARLVAGGHRVPPTAVITTRAYSLVAAELGELIEAARLGQVPVEEIDEAFARVEVPDELAIELVETAVGLGRRLAVRSSATVEDLAGSSFAGQYRSVLDVDADDPSAVLNAVRSVWASLWHPAPVAYRRALGVDDSGAAMAVVLMAMVEAVEAGVVFTLDPAGARDQARIEAVEGVGESLVSGQRTPRAWVTGRDDHPELPAVAATALAAALNVEADAGCAQDVEWAWDGEQMWVVQARPITVLATGADPFDSPVDEHTLTTESIGEMLPGVIAPLRWGVAAFLIDEAFRAVLDRLEATALDPDRPLIRRVRGRAALDLDVLRELAASMPGGDPDELEAQLFGTSAQPSSASRRRVSPRLMTHDLRVLGARRTATADAQVGVAAVIELRASPPTLPGESSELTAMRTRLIALAARLAAAELGVAAAAAASYRRLELLLARYLEPDEAAVAVQQVTRARRSMAPAVDDSANLVGGPSWAELGLTPPPLPEESSAMTDRATVLLDRLASQPRWRRTRLLTGQLVDLRRHLIERTISETSTLLGQREDAKTALLAVGGQLRRVEQAMARHLVGAGMLERADQVELLTESELAAALAGRRPELAGRADRLERQAGEPELPRRFRADRPLVAASIGGAAVMHGWAASPGRAEGRAVVLGSPTEPFPDGSVLVAAATDARWSPLFTRAAAVVVERGGPLSHAAILARELGVPAVLNLAGATQALDAHRVAVDGDSGQVAILDPGDPEDGGDSGAHGGAPAATSGWIDDVEGASLPVFVPAVMGVGVLFSLATLARDALRWGGRLTAGHRRRSAAIELARVTAGRVASPAELGLAGRAPTAVWAALLALVAGYVAVGSAANYGRAGGYVSDVAWLLVMALVVSALLATTAAAATAAALRWPAVPPLARVVLRRTPLTSLPRRPGERPADPRLLVGALVAALVGLLVTLAVGGVRGVGRWFDEPVAIWLREQDGLDVLRHLDPMGRTEVAVVLAGLIGISALRCRPLALAYPLVIVAGGVLTTVLKPLVERPRPLDGSYAGLEDSFPSGHLIQAVLIAVLLPVALEVITGDHRVVGPSRTLLGVGALGAAVHRVREGDHWPLDTIGGAVIALAVSLFALWAIDRSSLHRSCSGCPWHPGRGTVGVIDLPEAWARAVRRAAHLWLIVVAIGLAVAALTLGIPRNPDGLDLAVGFDQQIQLGFVAVLVIGLFIAAAHALSAAVLLVVSGVVLGVFSAVQYRPAIGFGLAVAIIVPAVGYWLSWQRHRSWRSIAAVAMGTSILLGGVRLAAGAVFDEFFGPTHPESDTVLADVDEVEWVWLGPTSDDSLIMTVRFDHTVEQARLHLAAAGQELIVEPARVDGTLARFEPRGLRADTAYRYRIEVDGELDEGRGQGRVRTGSVAPTHLRIAAASCARSGSNGSVFDQIRAQQPDLYMNLGDLHYANLETTDPGAYAAVFDHVATRPAQAALMSSVPMAYMWDDHDYGPNDSGADLAGGDAARQTYRSVVPHPPLALDGPSDSIEQAFTVGRVRVVMTDTRSHRTDETLLGATQEAWLIDEIRRAGSTHAVVVWANPTPWIGEATPGSDSWSGYPEERARIAAALADVDNLIMVSGDAHMVAIDDGTNSAYAGPDSGFPVLHAAALDRPGAAKGGPYSHGEFPGSGQFGTIDVLVEGEQITVTLTGWTWEGEILTRLEVPIPHR